MPLLTKIISYPFLPFLKMHYFDIIDETLKAEDLIVYLRDLHFCVIHLRTLICYTETFRSKAILRKFKNDKCSSFHKVLKVFACINKIRCPSAQHPFRLRHRPRLYSSTSFLTSSPSYTSFLSSISFSTKTSFSSSTSFST